MDSPKRSQILHKDSSFVIRRTTRPPSAIRATKIRDSPDKKGKDGRRSVSGNYALTYPISPSSLGICLLMKG